MRSVLSLLVVLVVAVACKSEPARAVASSRKDPAAARQSLAAGATIVDVRTPDEFADGHLPGATNIPVAELPRRLREVDQLVKSRKSAPLVVYCASGHRSAQAHEVLTAAGYTNVINGGGLDDLE